MPKSIARNKKRAVPPAVADNNQNKTSTNKKRKLPTNFRNAMSLEIVVGPQRTLVHTPVASDVIKEIFLDRLVKELVTPFLQKTEKSAAGTTLKHVMINGKLVAQKVSATAHPKPNAENPIQDAAELKRKRIKDRIVMGTNQCSRLLENLLDTKHKDDFDPSGDSSKPIIRRPSLIVLAKDIYPPTMLAHVPVLAKELGIPVLLLPGKASVELGCALQVRRTSVLIFLSGNEEEDSDSAGEDPIDSFVAFIQSQMPQDAIAAKEGA
jgi:hypothetical protein